MDGSKMFCPKIAPSVGWEKKYHGEPIYLIIVEFMNFLESIFE